MPEARRFVPRRSRGVTRQPVAPASTKTWWEQYSDSLKGNNLPHTNAAAPPNVPPWDLGVIPPSGTALQLGVMESTIDEIMTHVGPPFSTKSALHGQRIQVVGGVQSGKTASMIGVAAKALDNGFKIIVVLSGSKDLLRNQTAKRFNQQLLCVNEHVGGAWSHPSSAATICCQNNYWI